MDLFDIIPENFFSLLTGKNKRLYLACLIESFKTYEMGSILGIEKKAIVDELTDYLDSSNFSFTREDQSGEDEDEDDASNNNRSLAYFVLRRFEQCGWVYSEVTSDYEEILNFTDNGITFVEAIMNCMPWNTETFDYNDSDYETDQLSGFNETAYNGYIHTIYSLLLNSSEDYGLTITEVFRHTKMLIRALRKLDSRMKDYITSVVDNTDIHDLIEKLMNYKAELIDNGYKQLKTGDNINKYKLSIITNLEDIERTESKMYKVVVHYASKCQTTEEAYKKAYKDIDELIDVFNQLDDFIEEIDNKNTKYIDSTIGKIKFLLSEDDNTIGKLNDILKYIKVENSNDHIDRAITKVNDLFKFREQKYYNMEKSLYTPRGKYVKEESQFVDLSRFDLTSDLAEFLKAYENPYNDDVVEEFLNSHITNGEFVASDYIKYDSSLEEVLMILYALILGADHGMEFIKLDSRIEHEKFNMPDFKLREVK